MARRSGDLPDTRRPRPYRVSRSTSRSRLLSGIVGGVLLGAGILWIGWLITRQSSASALPSFSIPGLAPAKTPAVQIAPLAAEGITLGQPSQSPKLSQQQALLLASQLEPDAATQAKSTSAQYVLLNYPSTSTPAIHPDLNNVPAWMVIYQKIPLTPANASVDPTPFPRSYHDLYVFLDANSGKELLAVWV